MSCGPISNFRYTQYRILKDIQDINIQDVIIKTSKTLGSNLDFELRTSA